MGGMTGLLFLLWVGVTVSTAVNLQKRIIGGTKCNRPFHVMIASYDDNFMCGGSLISDHWILTAAHCWGLGMKAVLGFGSPQQDIMQITAPPVMYVDNNNMVHDVMLLQLPGPTKIGHVKLPDCNAVKRPPIQSQVQVAGHGATAAGHGGVKVGGFTSDLQCANIDVIDCQVLSNHLKNNFKNLYQVYRYQTWLCYQTHGVDTCPGDSGGGVVYNNMIYGVHSFSGSKSHACVEPGAFMDVCAYKQWITTITGIA